MNEKIEELYKECTSSFYVRTDGYGNDHYRNHTDYKQFAKLIIQECCGVCESDPVGDDPACCTNTAFRIARKINSHFKIE